MIMIAMGFEPMKCCHSRSRVDSLWPLGKTISILYNNIVLNNIIFYIYFMYILYNNY